VTALKLRQIAQWEANMEARNFWGIVLLGLLAVIFYNMRQKYRQQYPDHQPKSSFWTPPPPLSRVERAQITTGRAANLFIHLVIIAFGLFLFFAALALMGLLH
jgi:hypothetical protein